MKKIYFMAPVGGGPIKIGCSDLPPRRLEELQFWSPYRLEILASAPGDTKDERRIHTHFVEAWSHREWFNATPEIYALINEIRASGVLPLWVKAIEFKPRAGRPRKKWTDSQRANAKRVHQQRWDEIKASRAASDEVRRFFNKTGLNPTEVGEALGQHCSYVPQRVMDGGVCDLPKIEKLLTFIRSHGATPQ